MKNRVANFFVMQKTSLILLITAFVFILSSSFILLTHCNNKILEKQFLFLAWNEDEENSYEFAALNDLKFNYKISLKDSLNKKYFYTGNISKKSTRDTIFLKFTKNANPLMINNYLIVEVSGKYLIQTFKNNNKRVFLRRQNIASRGSFF